MLAINLVKENNILFEVKPIECILIYWKSIHNNIYIEHIKQCDDTIMFDANINDEILCFKLTYPTNINDSFYLETMNSNLNDEIIKIIEAHNLEAHEFDYSDFLEAIKSNNFEEMNIKSYILINFLTNLNNKLAELVIESSSSTEEITSVKEFDGININSENDNKKIFISTQKYIDVLRKELDIDINIEVNMADSLRITKMLEEVEYADKVLLCCNYILYENENVFRLKIPLLNFDKIKEDVILYMNYDALTYPYCIVEISFNVIFENNLVFKINNNLKKIMDWTVNPLHKIINIIYETIDKNGKILKKSDEEINITNALNILSLYINNDVHTKSKLCDETNQMIQKYNIGVNCRKCNELIINNKHPYIIKNSYIIEFLKTFLYDISYDYLYNEEKNNITLTVIYEIYKLLSKLVKYYYELLDDKITELLNNQMELFNECDKKNNNETLTNYIENLFKEYKLKIDLKNSNN